jgi:hypothetical protein
VVNIVYSKGESGVVEVLVDGGWYAGRQLTPAELVRLESMDLNASLAIPSAQEVIVDGAVFHGEAARAFLDLWRVPAISRLEASLLFPTQVVPDR